MCSANRFFKCERDFKAEILSSQPFINVCSQSPSPYFMSTLLRNYHIPRMFVPMLIFTHCRRSLNFHSSAHGNIFNMVKRKSNVCSDFIPNASSDLMICVLRVSMLMFGEFQVDARIVCLLCENVNQCDFMFVKLNVVLN